MQGGKYLGSTKSQGYFYLGNERKIRLAKAAETAVRVVRDCRETYFSEKPKGLEVFLKPQERLEADSFLFNI